MKRVIIGILVFLLILVGMFFLLKDNLFKKIGADIYYVQIIGEGKNLTGTHLYEYTLTGYDKNGLEKKITFNGLKQLRQEAYLEVYVKSGEADEVVTYNEVQKADIPAKANEKLK
ncbi:hypothetical protein C2W64_02607 [Brevibacillus laterosporus]|nr:YxeA family protein [Brevibacillus laterosporus]RAP30052.1 hypothetical protein C2W64_02607 [Brevibacillus laterosporus]